MISDTDLARLILSLEGAQLVRDLLIDQDGQIDGFDFDLLASLMAECPPEKCLLTLACAAHAFVDYTDNEPALRLSLKMLADAVLDDYAPPYLARLKNKSTVDYEGQIIYMQEDLEAFAELFALAGDLSPLDSVHYTMCAVLSDQAAAQAGYLDNEDVDIDYSDLGDITGSTTSATATTSLILFSDNVVPFPGLFRKT